MHPLSAGSATRARFWIPELHGVGARLSRHLSVSRRNAAVLAADLALAAASYTMAVFVSPGDMDSTSATSIVRATLASVLVFRLVALLCGDLHCRSLRYATTLDISSLTKTVAGGSLALAIFLPWRFPALKIPFSLFLVDASFLLLLWGALHFSGRILRTHRASSLHQVGRRTLIVGAGDAGIMLVREIALDPASPYRPIAILDDDASKHSRTICGLPVLGGTECLATVAAELHAEEVLVCIPSATRAQMRTILEACRRAELPLRVLPPLSQLVRQENAPSASSVTVSRRDLRPPSIEDLLDRETVRIDAAETRRLVAGETVLITGAGGSIGSELSRQVAAAGPRRLLLLDKSENGLFYANLEASERLGASNVKPFLCDLLDRARVRELLRAERPSIIFHAAAHKHVAMMDLYPVEAIRNNVLGTRNLAEAAVEFRVSRFVNISTDKAVNPRNWMGLSKRLTELCVQELSLVGATHFANVRFGNVAGSSGSVLRLFWERIQRGEPVRITDPRVTRFFMSVPEAVHLILRAAALGRSGETFVLEMGEPVNICELAKTMMLYSGLRPGHDLQIEFIGLHPGEKINEELWDTAERPMASGSDHILVIRERNALSRGILARINRVEELLARGSENEALEYLAALFPDFRWNRTSLALQGEKYVERAMARAAGAA